MSQDKTRKRKNSILQFDDKPKIIDIEGRTLIVNEEQQQTPSNTKEADQEETNSILQSATIEKHAIETLPEEDTPNPQEIFIPEETLTPLEIPVKEETLTPPVNTYQTATLADTFVGHRPDWLWSPEQVKTITSPPVLMVPDTQWDYWEVLSGSAVFTQLMTSNSYICGPPVDYNTGWNLSRKDHQKAILTLLGKHQPVVLWITLPHTTGRTFTHKETQLINFLRQMAEQQIHYNRHVFFEGLDSIPIWNHKSILGLNLNNKLFEDNYTWCGHAVKDIETQKAIHRPSKVIGTTKF